MYRAKGLISLLLITVTVSHICSAQSLYYIFLTDKSGVTSDANSYFSPEALARQAQFPADSNDLPIPPAYISTIREVVDSVRYPLRWLNALTVSATASQIQQVELLPFVSAIEPFGAEMQISRMPDISLETEGKFDTLLSMQRERMNLDTLAAHQLSGRGVRIAIFDTGFKDAPKHPALKHIFARKGVIATRDFYDGGENVYRHSRHGMQVMSCIGGMYRERQLGCARDADFLLARIEHERKEKAIEEDHWIAAAEWAHRMGAQIVTSAVTYTFKRYSYRDMNGRTAPVSKAAAIAAQKGMLIVCAMGNEGETDWRYMGAPADVPEVLSVGGSMPMVPMHIKFASVGPNAEKRKKPDVAAPAYVLAALKQNDFDVSAGTSFAAPLIAGLAACILQLHPDSSGTALFDKICKMGHYFPYYDYYLGYGIPDASYLFHPRETDPAPTFEVIHQRDSIILKFDPAVMIRDSIDHPNGRMLYYHFETPNRYLNSNYFELLPNRTRYYFFRRRPTVSGIVRIWFEGYLYEEENGIPK